MRALALLAATALCLTGCINYETVPGSPGDHCHADLNFAYCHVKLAPGEVVVTGTNVLSAIGAGSADVIAGVNAKGAVAK